MYEGLEEPHGMTVRYLNDRQPAPPKLQLTSLIRCWYTGVHCSALPSKETCSSKREREKHQKEKIKHKTMFVLRNCESNFKVSPFIDVLDCPFSLVEWPCLGIFAF
ncbi:hypothetical protein GOODEAATRI_019418 [Goodea atripinnis]|uniref:Uncharacterized protein n=1 Tax=Goodea atripinnis TaxID=208336 RepID=A0ABV0P678_9TELE